MSDKALRWIKVAEALSEIHFNPAGLAEIPADGRTVCLGRYKEELFAFAPRCPHASGFFVNGFIDAMGNVVCPLHRYKFCMKNGRNVSGEGYYLKHWPVKVEEEGVFIGFPPPSLFSW